ncbi:helical backbone metal receptor [Sporosarcina sp. 179-K 3D1 HS]|uniref:ABC transporter substrate-binding protein n=1 Tax=Sporosarcina sp. 179-K 3D1 HS TaxID=3232169 RepID=UPI00399F256A
MEREFIDHLNRRMTLKFPPQRIISLCPGITETLFAFQLGDRIVGRTRYCIFPENEVKQVPIVGGTKEMDIEKIHALQPDLIIVEKEENTADMVAALEPHYPVYVAEVQSIPDAYRMIQSMGELTERETEAGLLIREIQTSFQSMPTVSGQRVAYVIWKKPYMTVGKDTYIESVLSHLGFSVPFTVKEGRYPAVTEEDFREADLDFIFLASEPYPFRDKHLAEFQQICPGSKVICVDGEMFWYGARMKIAADYFKNLLAIELNSN